MDKCSWERSVIKINFTEFRNRERSVVTRIVSNDENHFCDEVRSLPPLHVTICSFYNGANYSLLVLVGSEEFDLLSGHGHLGHMSLSCFSLKQNLGYRILRQDQDTQDGIEPYYAGTHFVISRPY
jgi:hypothetical protein